MGQKSEATHGRVKRSGALEEVHSASPMSLSSSQSRKQEEGSASNLDMRYLAAFSLPLVHGKTSAWPRLKAAVIPRGSAASAPCTSSIVFLPNTFSLRISGFSGVLLGFRLRGQVRVAAHDARQRHSLVAGPGDEERLPAWLKLKAATTPCVAVKLGADPKAH